MLDLIHSNFNGCAREAWEAIAPGKAIVIDDPGAPVPMPEECLRVRWIDFGSPTEQANEIRSVIQLDLFHPKPINQAEMAFNALLQRAQALDALMGFVDNVGTGGFGVFKDPADPVTMIGVARMWPFEGESGWVNVAEKNKIAHISRTIEVYTTPVVP